MANSNLNREEDSFDDSRRNLHEVLQRRSAYPPKRHRILRIVAWTAASLVALIVVCMMGIVGLVNSSAGHRYIIGLAQGKASEQLGVTVAVQNYAMHWSGLGLDLYGVRIAGAAPHPNPPLFQADHIELSVQIISILQKKWHLQTVAIDHPVAWVVVDKDGHSNFPVIKSSGSSHTDIFDLGIRHLQITRGEVYYNSRPSAIAANLDGLEFKSAFDSLATRYSGTLSYSNGQLQFGNYRPLEHNLDATFDATRDQFTLKNLRVTAGGSSVTLAATAKNYQTDPDVHAQYQIVLDGKQAAQLLKDPSLPAGVVSTAGSVRYRQFPQRSVIESLTIAGDLSSPRLMVSNATMRLDARNLAAHYSLANGNAVLHDLRLYTLGGAVTAQGAMQQIGGNSHSSFRVAAQNLSLAQARQALARNISTNGISLVGTANAIATAEWGKTIDNLIAHADMTLNGQAVRPGPPAPAQEEANAGARPNNTVIPLHGAIHAIYTKANGYLTLNNTEFQSMQTQLRLNGTISRSSSLSVNLQANDLREIATLADLVRTPQPGALNLDLSGRASFQGSVRGSLDAPNVTGQFTAQNLTYNGTQWKTFRTEIAASPSQASIQNLELDGMKHEQVTVNAQVSLHNWSPTGQSPMQLDMNVAQITMDTLSALAGRRLPVSGTLNVSAHLRGEVENPTGHAKASLTDAIVSGEPVTKASVDLSGSGDQVKVFASVELPAGSVRASATTNPQAKTFTAQVQSSGIDLAKLKTVEARGIGAKGVVELAAQGSGNFDNPSISASVKIPTLTVGSQTISQTSLQLNAVDHIANAEFSSSFASAPIHGKAQVHLTGDEMADLTIDTPQISLEPIFAIFAPDEEPALTGQTELHVTLHGPLKNTKQLEAQAKLPLLKLAYNNVVQVSASPIQADLRDGMATLQPVTLRGTDTELNMQGSFPVGSQAPASLKAQGTVNLEIAQIFDPDLRASGQIKLNIDSHGALGSGLAAGEIDIAGANLSTNTAPVALQNANGVLKLTSDRLEIANFSGTVGGGDLTAQGAILYHPDIRFDLGAGATGVKMLYPQGVRETLDANLRLTGGMDHATLGGSVNMAGLSFTPGFDLTSVMGQLGGGVGAPPTPGFSQNLHLNLAVNSSNNIDLASRTLSMAGAANLQVRGTAAEPVILGRINLTSGDVILNGNRFVLTGGSIQFVNPTMTQPVLNVALTTTIQEYKIDLRFQGPSDQLRTQYTSDPSLPPADIIHLLAFGQTTEASAQNSMSMNQEGEALVASQVSSAVTSRVSKAAGISQLSISPVVAGGTAAGPPGANITIRQRVTGNLFVTFETNVVTTQGQTIQGQYQVSPRVAISATRDPNGGFAVDTLIKKSW